MGKFQYRRSVGDSILVFEMEIKERLYAIYGDTSTSISTAKNWFRACPFSMSHAQVPQIRLPWEIT